MEHEKTFVISLGGSMVMPGEVNSIFLKDFVTLIDHFVQKGFRFFIVIGGGKIARTYVDAARDLGVSDSNDLDWIGIQATRLNADLVRSLLRAHAPDKIIYGKEDAKNYTQHAVIVGGGWYPGGSSDMATTLLAKENGVKNIINLSNISFVYTADPKKDPSAMKLTNIQWNEYRKIIPADWTPGSNTPFDPTASKIAEKEDMSVAIMNGNNLENLQNFLEEKVFEGTLIHS